MIGYTLQIKNNFLVEKRLRKKLPNSITTFFLMLQFIYGYNFGFSDVLNIKIRGFCKLISLLVCIYTSIILLLCTPIFVSEWNMIIFWGSLYFVQYCGHIILSYFSEYKVHNFITEIRSVDDGIIYPKEHKIGLFACINFGFFFVTTMLSAVFCIVTNSECMLKNNRVNAIYLISVAGSEAIVFVQLIVNLYTYYAVVYLVGLVGREKTSLIRKQFLRISECCEKFGGYYGNLVLLELFITLPKYLTLTCNFIYDSHENVMTKISLIRLSYSIFVIFQMCAPALSVEVVNKQMEILRYKLYTRLMEERDIEKQVELLSLLRYMEQKPLYSKAWRVIPADINFVTALFNFVTTYVIVIIQFMHIY